MKNDTGQGGGEKIFRMMSRELRHGGIRFTGGGKKKKNDKALGVEHLLSYRPNGAQPGPDVNGGKFGGGARPWRREKEKKGETECKVCPQFRAKKRHKANFLVWFQCRGKRGFFRNIREKKCAVLRSECPEQERGGEGGGNFRVLPN